MKEGGTLPAVMNAANEAACMRFRAGETGIPGIWRIIGKTMEAHHTVKNPGWDDLLDADAWARGFASAPGNI